MFPGGMLGSARKLKKYGLQSKGGGAGGGGIDTGGNNVGGSGSDGNTVRIDFWAYQFDPLDITIGTKGIAGYKQPFDPMASPLQGWNGGGLGGPPSGVGQSGVGGQGGGATRASLRSRLMAGAAGGGGGGGGGRNVSGGNAGEFGTNSAAMPTDGSGQVGATPPGDGGTGGGGGQAGSTTVPGGQGGQGGQDDSSRSGGGRNGTNFTDLSMAEAFTGTPLDLSSYGRGGNGGNPSTNYGYRPGDGQDGSNGVAVVTDYETGQHYWITSSQLFTLP
ncbi:MAG: hypothetical protein ACLGJC_04470 [Alphaproteobacteria bacterium]